MKLPDDHRAEEEDGLDHAMRNAVEEKGNDDSDSESDSDSSGSARSASAGASSARSASAGASSDGAGPVAATPCRAAAAGPAAPAVQSWRLKLMQHTSRFLLESSDSVSR